MRKDHLLLGLVILDFLLVVLTVGVHFALNSTLPEPLRAYQFGNLGIVGTLALFPLWVAIIIATLVAWVGLINFWNPARLLYTGAWGAWLILLAAAGPSVTTGVGSAVETLEHLVGGAIIALVYFSDLSKKFEEADEEGSLDSARDDPRSRVTSARVPGSPAVP